MIKQMTNSEKQRLLTDSFSKLWGDLWGTPPGLTVPSSRANDPYKAEEQNSRNKFESLRNGVYTKMDSHNLEELIKIADTNWTEPEWGFPKGRRNYQERDYDCAVREFCEETGYGMDQLVLLKNIQPFEETFTGSNYKSYKHKYYVTYIKYKDTLSYRHLQTSEVSGSSWMTADMCNCAIRSYNVEKRRILESVEKMLNNNTLTYMS
jgi:ADP-ribose pyrophosphatase YjhB (NUDIX family)